MVSSRLDLLFIAVAKKNTVRARLGGLDEFECPMTLVKNWFLLTVYTVETVDSNHESVLYLLDHGDWKIYNSREY